MKNWKRGLDRRDGIIWREAKVRSSPTSLHSTVTFNVDDYG